MAPKKTPAKKTPKPRKRKTPQRPAPPPNGPAADPSLAAGRSVFMSVIACVVAAAVGAAGGWHLHRPSSAVVDDVDTAFDKYESLWRSAQGELASRLESGQITSESAATDWFGAINKEARGQAFADLLKKEADEFGGEKWTAAKHAASIRRYVR